MTHAPKSGIKLGLNNQKKNPKTWSNEGHLKLHVKLLLEPGYFKPNKPYQDQLDKMKIIEEILELHDDSRSYSISINEFYYRLDDNFKLVRK